MLLRPGHRFDSRTLSLPASRTLIDKTLGGIVCINAEHQALGCAKTFSQFETPWNPPVSSTEINLRNAIETYVADGFGIGPSVSIPKTKLSLKVLSLLLQSHALADFDALSREKDIVSVADIAGQIAGHGTSFTSLVTLSRGLGNGNGKGVAAWNP
jgi:hypothetical protein